MPAPPQTGGGGPTPPLPAPQLPVIYAPGPSAAPMVERIITKTIVVKPPHDGIKEVNVTYHETPELRTLRASAAAAAAQAIHAASAIRAAIAAPPKSALKDLATANYALG